MPHDRRGVARRLLARVPDDCHAQRRLQRVRLAPLRVELPEPRRVREQGEAGPVSTAAAAAALAGRGLSKGLGGVREGRRRLRRQLERVGGRQRVVLVKYRGPESRGGQGPPVEAGDVADGEVREQERGGGGGLFFVEVEEIGVESFGCSL